MTLHKQTRDDGPKILRCTSVAELLGTLPVMLGYEVRNSLLITLFRGQRTTSAMRFDLPRADTPLEGTGIFAAVTDLLRRLPGVDGIAIVIYTDETFRECGGVPRRFLALQLKRELSSRGFLIEALCCVAADGWADYFDGDPTLRRPLDEISSNTTSLQARYLMRQPLPRLTDLSALPQPTTAFEDGLRRALDSSTASDSGLHDLPEVASSMQRLIDEGLHTGMFTSGVRVARAAASSPTWLLLLSVAVIGRDGALALFREIGAVHDVGPRAIRAFTRMFSARYLNESKIRGTIDRVGMLVTNLPECERPGLLVLQAWLWWMTAMLSPAHTQVTQALAIDPGNQLAVIVQEVINGGPPRWVFSEQAGEESRSSPRPSTREGRP